MYPQGTNDFGDVRYGGPYPPVGSTHNYHFKVYALDTMIFPGDGATKEQVLQEMSGHGLAMGELIGTYTG